MLSDIMIDLETLATSPNAAVLTIGAVRFDPFNNDIGNPTCEKLYIRVDLDSCDELGLEVNDDTIAWWAQQSKEAQEKSPQAQQTENIPATTTQEKPKNLPTEEKKPSESKPESDNLSTPPTTTSTSVPSFSKPTSKVDIWALGIILY